MLNLLKFTTVNMLIFSLSVHRTKIRDLAETKYGKVPSGDTKPNSWTLLDFGKYMELRYKFALVNLK